VKVNRDGLGGCALRRVYVTCDRPQSDRALRKPPQQHDHTQGNRCRRSHQQQCQMPGAPLLGGSDLLRGSGVRAAAGIVAAPAVVGCDSIAAGVAHGLASQIPGSEVPNGSPGQGAMTILTCFVKQLWWERVNARAMQALHLIPEGAQGVKN
jgi:hypothetical protein